MRSREVPTTHASVHDPGHDGQKGRVRQKCTGKIGPTRQSPSNSLGEQQLKPPVIHRGSSQRLVRRSCRAKSVNVLAAHRPCRDKEAKPRPEIARQAFLRQRRSANTSNHRPQNTTPLQSTVAYAEVMTPPPLGRARQDIGRGQSDEHANTGK